MANTVAPWNSLSASSRWRIVVMMAGFAALGHFNRVCISVAGADVFIAKLGISAERMGWVYSSFLIVYTVGMIPGGWLIDRIGAARALGFFGLSMGTMAALTGGLGLLTITPAVLWMGLLAVRGLAGICNVPLHPGAAHVVSDLMHHRNRATANGIITAGALVGIAFSYPMFGWLMDRIGWPLAFAACGLLLVAYGVLWRMTAEPRLPGPSLVVEEHSTDRQTARKLLRDRNLWLVSLSFAAYGYFQYLFFYWTNYYFESVLHVSSIESRRIAFFVTLSQGAGMVFGGLCTDFFGRWFGISAGRRGIVVLSMGMGGVFGLLGVNVTGQTNVALCLALAMASLGTCESVFWTTATDIGRHSRGFAAAFMNTAGNAGGIFSPVLTPYLAQEYGWPSAIGTACAIAALGGAVWFLIKIPQPHTNSC